MRKLEIAKGTVFGRLTTIKETEPNITPGGQSNRKFLCICTCGTKTKVFLTALRSGDTTSCGCYGREQQKLAMHAKVDPNKFRHYLKSTWSFMTERCHNPEGLSYKNYGQRGIRVCKSWRIEKGDKGLRNFVKWAEENGWYEGCNLQLDRIDTNGNYEPSNCRWVTCKVNQRNRRNNVIVKYKGESLVAAECVEKYAIPGISTRCFIDRIDLGWTVKKSLITPVGKIGRPTRILKYKGSTMSATEIIEKYGIKGLKLSHFIDRLKLGWEIDRALSTPLKKRT